MPETEGAPGGESPDAASPSDYFDRLLARHTRGATPRAGVARVRPRLAGPFERVEAVRGAGLVEADGAEPLWPSTAQSPVQQGELGRMEREVRFHSERERTVVRAEPAPAPAPLTPRPSTAVTPAVPLLRPAAAPVPRALPDTSRRAAARERTAVRPSQSAASAPVPPGADAAAAAVPAPLRPSAVDTAAARDAARQSSGRRGARGGEQVVHVQIGRLEVTAAGAAPAAGGRGPGQAPGRQGATVSLQDYLARGRDA
ncbi:hypothetical protein [Streptomyces sp. NBC_01304]|uniref:hypothetical protein n=1 Tax=Streptomyces sp. NBC_01304 TaxID=2903818 RepID=UPI002E155EA2|nr:hypothetical protein OG430_08535 [Streptomyces sp. NBC_01304]